ncbi:hypothetical protein KQI84_06075 [bacterium]|nr:hypothetical protein [bacterium]
MALSMEAEPETPPHSEVDPSEETSPRPARDGWTLRRVALLAGGAVPYAFAVQGRGLAPLGILAIAFWWAAIRGAKPPVRRMGVAAAAYAAISLGLLNWLYATFGLMTLVLYAIIALYPAIWAWLATEWGRFPLARAAWAAACWVGIDYLRGELAPLDFSWLSLGYETAGTIGGMTARWIGVYGVSGITIFVAVLAAEAICLRSDRKKMIVGIAAAAAWTILVLVPVPRFQAEGKETYSLRLLNQGKGFGSVPAPKLQPGERVDLVVWPEYSLGDSPEVPGSSWLVDEIKTQAASSTFGVIFGAVKPMPGGERDKNEFFNTAFVCSPEGEFVGEGSKSHPVPFMIDGQPAPEVGVVDLKSRDGDVWRIGLGICFDGAYQRYAPQMARRGAQALVFPTYNMHTWGAKQHRQHRDMFRMRAIETGLPVITSAYGGPTFAATSTGAIINVADFGETAYLSTQVPITPNKRSLFTLFGWLIGPTMLILVAGKVLWMFFDWARVRRANLTSP